MTNKPLPDDAALDALDIALDDLREYVKAEWGWPDIHPANQRKFDRDVGAVKSARDELTALRARNAALQAQVTAQALDAMALADADEIVGMVPRDEIAEAARDELKAAAEPFARFAEAPYFARLPDECPMTQGSSLARRQITAGDFKRLHAALRALAGKGE